MAIPGLTAADLFNTASVSYRDQAGNSYAGTSNQVTVQVAGALPVPVLDGFAAFTYYLHRQDALRVRLSGGNPDRLNWTFVPGSPLAGQRLPAGAAAIAGSGYGVTTAAPSLALSDVAQLTEGIWHVSVTATNISGTSRPAEADFALVTDELSGVRVYPNPWRRSRDLGVNTVHFDPLPANAHLKIFSISGHLVRDLGNSNGSASWDVKNDDGDYAASGIYIYLITDDQGNKERGKLVVIQ